MSGGSRSSRVAQPGRALLDVNVLLALLDADHLNYRQAHTWLAEEGEHGWASCAITQNGFVRIISQPKYPSPMSPALAMERLEEATANAYHQFWSCDFSLLDERRIRIADVLGPRQVTDFYLLALAVKNGGRFVTFDRGVSVRAVVGAKTSHLVRL